MILHRGSSPRRTAVGSAIVFRKSLAPSPRARWAWLSDTHVSGDQTRERDGWSPARQLRRAIREVVAAGPDGIAVNGDVAWKEGRERDYAAFLDLIEPAAAVPTVLGIGNHDRRDNLLAACGVETDAAPTWLASVVDQPPYRFVMLDSLLDTSVVAGAVGKSQARWLARLLADSPRARTVLFVHHPGESASEGCRDFDALAGLAESHETVQAIVTGHDHRFSVGRAGGAHLVALPATGFPFEPGVDCGWVEAALAPGGMRLRFHGRRGTGDHWLNWR